MENCAQNPKRQRRLVYIMGPNYSGSTLLTLLLADHPQIATVGELKATSMGDISIYRCSCGELLTDCSFWSEARQLMSQQGKKLVLEDFRTHFRDQKHSVIDRLFRTALRGPLFEAVREAGFALLPSARKTRDEITRQNQALVEIICTLQHAPIFLDDSKEPVRLKFLLTAGIWDIRVIHLIRDGRGVTNSYMRHNKATMSKAAKEWMHTQFECDRMRRMLGSNLCLPVHYENLCREPEKILDAISQFLSLDPELSTPSTRIKHIMGNQMRLGSLQDIQLDEKWKQTLSAEDLHIFTTTAGTLNKLHGYS